MTCRAVSLPHRAAVAWPSEAAVHPPSATPAVQHPLPRPQGNPAQLPNPADPQVPRTPRRCPQEGANPRMQRRHAAIQTCGSLPPLQLHKPREEPLDTRGRPTAATRAHLSATTNGSGSLTRGGQGGAASACLLRRGAAASREARCPDPDGSDPYRPSSGIEPTAPRTPPGAPTTSSLRATGAATDCEPQR